MRGTLDRHQDSLGKIPKNSEKKKKKIQEHAVWDDDDWGGGFLPLRIDAAHTANANDWIPDHPPPLPLHFYYYLLLLLTTYHPPPFTALPTAFQGKGGGAREPVGTHTGKPAQHRVLSRRLVEDDIRIEG